MLIAAGQAQDAYEACPEKGPVMICNEQGRPRWQPLWAGNPAIRVPGPSPDAYRGPHILTGGGCLPYLQYPYSAETGWSFTDWRVRDHRPRIYLTEAERELGHIVRRALGPFLLIEPTALRKSVNRRPPVGFWLDVVAELMGTVDLALVQLAHPDAVLLRGLIPVGQRDFREACGILAAADGLVATEGGLVHAAAALGTPTIALWGGCISVEALGYPEHSNVVDDSDEPPCGALRPCDHCVAAWARLTHDRVVAAVQARVTQRM